MRKGRKWYNNRLVPWILPVVTIILWQLLVQYKIVTTTLLPSPLEVVEAAIKLSKSGELQEHVYISTQRALIGFAIGGIIGFILGLVNGTVVFFERTIDTTIQMIRTIPHLALIPLVILWFGIGESAKIFLVALGVMFPIYINTFNGIKNVDRKLIEMGSVYGLSRNKLFTNIILPGALPSILVGIRYALGVMWVSLIVAETIGADSGIGFLATSAREFMQMDIIVLTIVLYAILGKLSDLIAKLFEHRLLKWHPAFHKK
ncbi:aliphatic sulfonate ABC transporter permease SsuC [Lysinibacillus telephonicus]|uniref:Aliphatic sulfonate ABC transporter permease SsuC n=1 Tax=Lysinibacillus telephonicus TaxID=1714840 RepID=A0A3S0KJA1_9BACI|nr:aliphatic sulfonate ABC transporter permease SsuC [Lysinibacillus telephonicus]RTQ93010.1 aliphatic sulfonate ABC transporter permease SsuC [Lysinibacillus telephonicus]